MIRILAGEADAEFLRRAAGAGEIDELLRWRPWQAEIVRGAATEIIGSGGVEPAGSAGDPVAAYGTTPHVIIAGAGGAGSAHASGGTMSVSGSGGTGGHGAGGGRGGGAGSSSGPGGDAGAGGGGGGRWP